MPVNPQKLYMAPKLNMFPSNFKNMVNDNKCIPGVVPSKTKKKKQKINLHYEIPKYWLIAIINLIVFHLPQKNKNLIVFQLFELLFFIIQIII